MAHRRRRATAKDIPPGPTLGELIAAYRTRLAAKTPDAQRAFAFIARKLGPLADRRILTFTAPMWEAWIAEATAGFSDSYRRQTRAYLRAMLQGTAHHLARGPGRQSLAPRAIKNLTPAARVALTRGPLKERHRPIGHLVVAGFQTREILGLRMGSDGRIELGPPNWRRRSVPSLTPGLEVQLQAYASAKGITVGAPLFPLSAEGIRLIVKRGLGRAGETEPRGPRHTGSLSSRLRELLRPGPQPLTALAAAVDAKSDSAYRALRSMKDAAQVGGLKGRGRESVWSLKAPQGPG
ncbi:MAG: hypothetical protein ACREJ4_05405 [Candidatus Methylomirabilaceae bacterium]